MNRAWWLLAASVGIPAMLASTPAQAPRPAQLLWITVDAPGSPGATVTLRYVRGPDSLQGKTVQLTVPRHFTLQADILALVAERPRGQGAVRLRVERVGGQRLDGEGTGDRVQIQVWPDSIDVRTLPWQMSI